MKTMGLYFFYLLCHAANFFAAFAALKENKLTNPQDLWKDSWNIKILSDVTSHDKTIVKKYGDTLNLTCEIAPEPQLSLKDGSRKALMEDYYFEISWALPSPNHSSPDHILYNKRKSSHNLVVKDIEEKDQGRYSCSAKISSSDVINPTRAWFEYLNVVIKEDLEDCSESSYICSSGECIPQRYICNGRKDCQDLSDEIPKICGKAKCKGLLKCGVGTCLHPVACCNRARNCSLSELIDCCKHSKEYGRTDNWPPYSAYPSSHFNNRLSPPDVTMYSVIGYSIAVVIMITVMVIALFRLHLKRTALRINSLNPTAPRRTSWNSVFHPTSVHFPQNNGTGSGLLVSYNVGNGVHFLRPPIRPPPYSEVIRLPPWEDPPPPYVSVENLVGAEDAAEPTNEMGSPSRPLENRPQEAHEPLLASISSSDNTENMLPENENVNLN